MNKQTKMATRTVAMLSMLVALSIVCGKVLAFNAGEVLRFSFENLPIIFAGIGFGPLCGMLVGLVADLVGCALVGYVPIPLVTVGGVLIGGISGGLWMLLRKLWRLPQFAKLAFTVLLSHLVGSVLVKTFGLAHYYDMPIHLLMLWRLLNYLIIGGVEWWFLCVLCLNKSITAHLPFFHAKSVEKNHSDKDTEVKNHDI